MNFPEIAKMMNQMYSKTQKLPKSIKVNSHWYELQLQSSFILKNPNENAIEKMTGVKVEFDDNIKTFEFVYDK